MFHPAPPPDRREHTRSAPVVPDAPSDIYATTAAIVGAFGIAVGSPGLDPLAAGVVGVLVFREGAANVTENARYLTGAAPAKAIRRRISSIARSHPRVRDVRDVRTHYVGPEIEVELRAQIPDESTVEETQAIETELEEDITDLDDVHHVQVHFEPESTPKPADEIDDSEDE